MRHISHKVLLCLGVLSCAAVAPADWILDGDMDALLVGTNPDVGLPAGAWFFPPEYLDPEYVAETDPNQLTIVPTSSFIPGAPGNSLRLNISAGTTTNVHLPNIFTQVIPEKPGEFTRVTFDLFVPAGPWGGGSVYIGGNHSGTGFHSSFDRGPQMSWFPDDTLRVTQTGGAISTVGDYPRDQWQTLQVDIDLVTDTYDLFWGLKGGTLAQIGDGLAFRSGLLDHLDRFTYVNFGGTIEVSSSYLDNVTVQVIPEPAGLALLGIATLLLRRRM